MRSFSALFSRALLATLFCCWTSALPPRSAAATAAYAVASSAAVALVLLPQTVSPGRLHVHEGILPQRARGAVFDMDGTLLDTNDRRVESWQAACSQHGLHMDKPTYMALTGMSGQDIVDRLCADQGVDLPLEARRDLVTEENRLFKERGLPASPAVSPVLDVLDEAQRRGMKLAVCSGGTRDAVERSLSERGLADRFEAIVTSADVPHAKPEPDIFLLAAERLGLRPEQCVAFEDAPMGKQSARAAGYLAVVDVTKLPGHPDGVGGGGNDSGRAFFHGNLDKLVYVDQSEGFVTSERGQKCGLLTVCAKLVGLGT
ncbi:hypothetical protein VOLCADRAFT_96762 [Volvox carteri f. nagariensis]|uniref:Uncharacterized protein n=1 Tax=Volvox carteri f. nagariensis TaxID=3068 RepID=D8UAZ5_VOLCA|nr:uncharacterized protein VOLCADRAFT_96762 [Volvox carteri f. nagariensis]EFJ43023.1 hypothetical protein VOLCADRAFT_96762 [Volvox carteri f. nagariensis]|eukprot:XP_002955822.1 hypothetical protein VOLCADRAFT_96762 [Volvox carteri f. nagariensis]